MWLTERRHPGIAAAAAPLLEDFDEGVRYAAAEAMLAQNDESAREPLLAVIADPEEESNRLKLRIADVFAQRRWSVEEVDEAAIEALQGYTVQGGRLVAG